MTVTSFRVERMDCAAEEQLVRMALADLDAVERVKVDLDARVVDVDHRGDAEEIEAALGPLGLGAERVASSDTALAVPDAAAERRGLTLALVINAGFFVAELLFGLISRSMSLIADGLDMGADASVYALSLAAVGTAASRKKRIVLIIGYVQLTLALLGLAEVVRRFVGEDELPDPATMIVVSLLALIGNAVTLLVLRRIRTGEVHIQASWICTANDVQVNAAVIVAGVVVAATDSATPDLIAGAIIFAILANGARRILGLSLDR